MVHAKNAKLKIKFYRPYIITNMTLSTQITNNEIFAPIAVLVFKLLSPKVLFINKKDNRHCLKGWALF